MTDVVCCFCMELLQGKWLKAKLLLAASALAVLSSCASIGPPMPPSLELPHPASDLRAVRKGDKVTLTWTIPARTTYRQSVRYLGETHICRSVDAPLVTCGMPVGEVTPPANFENGSAGGKKLAATFTDTLPPVLLQPSSTSSATYAVEVFNRDARSAGLSNQVQVSLAEVFAPPEDFRARVTAQGVALDWTGTRLSQPLPNFIRRGYRVYRRPEGSRQTLLVGERDAGSEKQFSLTDQSFEWEKTYYYRCDSFTVVTKAGKPEVALEGDDTPEVKVFAHDIFPPAVPSGVQAVFSGAGQRPFIDLVWAPVSDSDLDGYNIYRREENGAAVKINSEPVKMPAFRDLQIAAGKTYSYSVSAVDLRGNESAPSAEASESAP